MDPVGGYFSCDLYDFYYDIGSRQLRFAALEIVNFDGSYYSSTRLQTLDPSSAAVVWYTDWGITHYSYVTPATRFTITTAVPEPSTYLMLGAGLGLLGLGVRRRT